MSPNDIFFLCVGVFVTCRLWMTVNGMLDALIEFGINGGNDGQDDEESPPSVP